MRPCILIAALSLALTAAHADALTPAAIQRAYADARPTARAMPIYALDWTATLTEARARARTERRPILLIYVTNITGPTRFYEGHC